MKAADYLAFVPLLLYGIGLADLLAEWKRLFDPKTLYLPYLLVTIMLTETAIYNVFIYLDIVNQFEGLSYLDYLRFLVGPFLFLITVNAFTPEKEADTKTYFTDRLPIFFGLLASLVASHFLYEPEYSNGIFLRIAAVLVIAAIGFFRKVKLIYPLFAIWLLSFLFKANIIAQ